MYIWIGLVLEKDDENYIRDICKEELPSTNINCDTRILGKHILTIENTEFLMLRFLHFFIKRKEMRKKYVRKSYR